MKFEFRFPDIGEGIAEGTLIKWLVKEGEDIEEGQSVAEVETDKVTTEIPSPRTGKVSELKAEEGDVINVGDVFITIDILGDIDEVDKKDELPDKNEVVEEETAGVVGEVIASSEEIPPSTEGQGDFSQESRKVKVLATPVARKMAKDLGVDISKVKGTGPSGRVMKEDIRKAKEAMVKSKEERKIPELGHKERILIEDERIERIPLTRIRKTIAEQMAASRFTIPHTTAMDEIDVTELYEFRKKYKERLREEEVNLTFLPFILKAVITALKEFPEFNSSLDEENDELILKHFYHIGIATDTDRGLMVPVLRNGDKKSIVEIAKEIEDLSSRAKDNKIELRELKGSTFTITNYGSIGGQFGIPIINYPESAILGIGRIVKKPIVKDDEIVIARMLPLSLSYDHRIIDGASGARFLNLLSELLKDPEILLLKS
ncbi:dihydrolipoamide acetyltransferase family protein [Clostridium sp. Cult1]|uniref:dihydrolipoamide acetyltransferase family protein n=1 Tax=Clostridium sp. Cult1 TaxID=2079002 RepID=UPI001F1CB29A|nr:dihydrolipoamide acetyltransferase family protein [Clostridium sp. Cult1]MCF6463484.1 dihydrolipoamide acyltransferase [Clostridium sp. Cult1]